MKINRYKIRSEISSLCCDLGGIWNFCIGFGNGCASIDYNTLAHKKKGEDP
jgi:hypothetical protein